MIGLCSSFYEVIDMPESLEVKVARIDERTLNIEKVLDRLEKKIDIPCPHHESMLIDVQSLRMAIQQALSDSKLDDAAIKKDMAVLAVKVSAVTAIVMSTISVLGTIFLTKMVGVVF